MTIATSGTHSDAISITTAPSHRGAHRTATLAPREHAHRRPAPVHEYRLDPMAEYDALCSTCHAWPTSPPAPDDCEACPTCGRASEEFSMLSTMHDLIDEMNSYESLAAIVFDS